MADQQSTSSTPPDPGAAPKAVSPAAGDPRSTGQILKDVLEETQNLFRKELELAKIELTDAITARLVAAGAAAVAALFALFALGFAGVTVAKALEEVLAPWAAWLIVTAGFFLVTVIGLLVARNRVNAVPMQPEQTKASIEENVQWAKQQLKR